METSGFFNAERLGNNFDRVYPAEFFAKYFASFIGNGVFGGRLAALQVVLSGTFGVRVQNGQGYINGYWYENDADMPFSLAVGGSQPRIDTIVLRLNMVTREIRLAMAQGTPSASPVAPTLTRNANTWELGLANINIAANATSITVANIVDTRLDTARCGLVHGVVDQLDTTEYGNRLNGFIENFIAGIDAEYQNLFLDPINALITDANTLYNNTFLPDINATIGLATSAYNDFLAWIESKKTDSTQKVQDLIDQLNQILGDADVGAILVKLNELSGKVDDLGTAAFEDSDAFATAAQGALADSAVQTESDPIYIADKPTLVTLGTPQIITAAKTFQHPTNPNRDITIEGREFSEHPVVPAVTAQTSFNNRSATRYVTECQLLAGGVEGERLDIPMISSLAAYFSSAVFSAVKKNGYVTLVVNAIALSNQTFNASEIFMTPLPPELFPAMWVGWYPIISAQQSIVLGRVNVRDLDGMIVWNFHQGITFNQNSNIGVSFTYPHK